MIWPTRTLPLPLELRILVPLDLLESESASRNPGRKIQQLFLTMAWGCEDGIGPQD
jgi:hypothetical protein